jgi:hypothetical protein
MQVQVHSSRSGIPEKESGKQHILTGLGAILVRSDQDADARFELEKALGASDATDTSPDYTRHFLAMTEHHLGNDEAAHDQLETANKSAEAGLAETPSWNPKLTLELLRTEAEALIGKLVVK